MKKCSLIVLFIFTSLCIYAQDMGINASVNLGYISISESFADNIKRNITSPRNIRLEENGVSIGGEVYGFYRNIMLGGGFHRFVIDPGRDNRMNLTTAGIYGMLGYNFSKNAKNQLIASVRGGIMRNNLEIPFVNDETRRFGEVLIEEDTRFVNTSILLGGEILANRRFSSETTGFAVGIGAFYDLALGNTNWNYNGVKVQDIEISTYSYYGLVMKFSGGWNEYNGY